MTDYSAEEVEQVVLELVRSRIDHTVTLAGTRDLGLEFDELREAAAGLLLTQPQAVFYLVALGRNRVLEAVYAEGSLLDRFKTAARASGRRVVPLSTTAPLSNASAALRALEHAASTRTEAFDDLSTVPAYQRYIENTQRFLREAATSLIDEGTIVTPPATALAQLPALVRDLEVAHRNLYQLIGYLIDAQDDFNQLGLGGLLATSVIAQSRASLERRLKELEQRDKAEQLEVLRDVVLDVIGGRAAIKGLAGRDRLTLFVPLSGQGFLVADADRPGTPAVLATDAFGPYALVPGQSTLQLLVDGSHQHQITLPAGYIAHVQGIRPSPFEVTDGSGLFEVATPGYPTLSVAFVDDIWEVEDVVHTLNDAVTGQPLHFESRHTFEKYLGTAHILEDAGTTQVTLPLPGMSWEALSIVLGDTVQVETSPGYWTLYEVTEVTELVLSASIVWGTPAVTGPLQNVRVGGPQRYLRVGFASSEHAVAIADELSFTLAGTVLPTFGMPAVTVRCVQMEAEALVTAINATATPLGQPVLRAETVFVPRLLAVQGRTDPNDPTRLFLELPVGEGVFRHDRLRLRGQLTLEGEYVAAQDSNAEGYVRLTTAVPAVRSVGGAALGLEIDVGRVRPELWSLSTGLQSSIEVIAGPAADQLFNGVPHARGAASWLRLPSTKSGVRVGDTLELHANHYAEPSQVCVIRNVEEALVEIDPALPNDTVGLDFHSGQTPFARIRRQYLQNYETLRQELAEWVRNQPTGYFRELQRLVNIVRAAGSPTASSIGELRNHLILLEGTLTAAGAAAAGIDPDLTLEAILLRYETDPLPQVDVLLDTYRQKGADRALEFLLSGRFSEFFGLDREGVSHIGHALSTLRDVQKQDLPLTTATRTGAVLFAQYDGDDPDFTAESSSD